MTRRSRIVMVGLVGAVVALLVVYSLRHKQSAERRPAPDFTLPALNGGTLQLSSFRGKVVLVDFWATWCEPCREETPHLVEMQDKYKDRGLQIIGVSMDDTPDPVHAFYEKFHMNYPVVMGTASTGEQYGGVLGLPIAYFIDRDGKVAAKKIGAQKPEAIENEIKKLL